MVMILFMFGFRVFLSFLVSSVYLVVVVVL